MSPGKIFLSVNGFSMSLAKLLENPTAATSVWVENCAGLTALPDLPAATYVWVMNCAGLTALPDLPAATYVRVENCAGLTALPDLPAATDVWVMNCAGLTVAFAGKDTRGYGFYRLRMRGAWRIVAGCRIKSFTDALAHWGPGGAGDRPDCLALVQKLIATTPADAR